MTLSELIEANVLNHHDNQTLIKARDIRNIAPLIQQAIENGAESAETTGSINTIDVEYQWNGNTQVGGNTKINIENALLDITDAGTYFVRLLDTSINNAVGFVGVLLVSDYHQHGVDVKYVRQRLILSSKDVFIYFRQFEKGTSDTSINWTRTFTTADFTNLVSRVAALEAANQQTAE